MEEVDAKISIFRSKYIQPIVKLFSADLFVQGLRTLLKDTSTNDPGYLAEMYFDVVLDISNDLYVCSEDTKFKYGKTEKWFLALDKVSLELTTREYLTKSWHCQNIDHFILASFIGHENETFAAEMQSVLNPKVSFVSRLFFGKQILEAREKVEKLLARSQSLYDLVLTSHISPSTLREVAIKAQSDGIYVNPYVLTIVDRCLDRGVKEFFRK